jgi:CheY-like chemotaxis protein
VAPKVLDLNETVAAMLKMLGRLMGEDISLTWTPGDDIAPVRIDPAQVDQILANLCVNARDAINHDRGNIVIETRMADVDADYCEQHLDATPGRYVVLSVSDNGTGMSGETLQHIFEPFFTTKEVGAGTGLGLATVYGAVKQNSGFVTVYSELGVGTTFHVFLPEMLERCSFASAYASVGPMSGDETILLVEDEPAMLSMTRAMLVRLGYRVIAASTPLEAIHTFEQLTEPLDLLITDVVMPQMNGRELAQRLKVRQPNLRCIYCSGYTARLIAHHGILDADVNLLLKPFSSAQLASMVRAVLQA